MFNAKQESSSITVQEVNATHSSLDYRLRDPNLSDSGLQWWYQKDTKLLEMYCLSELTMADLEHNMEMGINNTRGKLYLKNHFLKKPHL